MANVSNDIERLIVRGLDGELSEDEELALNRELIRSPEAHRLMEEYRRCDELAAAALHQALDRHRLPLDPEILPDRREAKRLRSLHRIWWLVPGAIAAALLAVAVARLPGTVASRTSIARYDRKNPISVPPSTPPVTERRGIMRTVGTDSPDTRIRRVTGRDFFGVMAEDGSIYWIEVDRVRTLRRPTPEAAAALSGETL